MTGIGTQISDMTDSVDEFPDEAFVPFVVESASGGLSPSSNYRYKAGQKLAKYSVLAEDTGASLVGSDDGASGSLWTTLAGFITYLRSSVGAAIVGFSQTASYASASVGNFLALGPVNVRGYPYNATGDGTTDVTAVIQAALDTGNNVYFPPASVDYEITGALVPVNGQSIYGAGNKSIIRQTGTGAGASCFVFSAKSNVTFQGLHFKPQTAGLVAQTEGFGVHADNSTNIQVIDCETSAYRRGHVVLVNCVDCEVSGSYIHDSVVNPATDNSDDGAYEVLLLNGGENIRVENNTIRSGGGFGFVVQSSIPGTVFDTVAIVGNSVLGNLGYGILVYAANNTDIFHSITVSANVITDISGELEDSSSGNKIYGAGIYIQGAEGVVVSGNALSRTNTDTDTESLAPGAIGFINCRTGNITGNSILEPYWYGIFAGDPLTVGIAGGSLTITGNYIDGLRDVSGTPTKSTKDGIFLKDFPRATVSANPVSNFGGAGIRAANTGTSLADAYALTGNACLLNDSGGINIEDGDSLIQGNITENNTTAGILVQGTGSHIVKNNRSSENSTYGFSAQATGDIEATGNIFKTNTTAHVSTGAPVRGLADNFFGAGVTIDNGSYPIFTALDDTGTPSVRNGTDFVTGGTTAITNFDDGADGQTITVFSAHAVTVTQGSTIKLNGSANFVMASGDTLTLRSRSGIWYELGRLDA